MVHDLGRLTSTFSAFVPAHLLKKIPAQACIYHGFKYVCFVPAVFHSNMNLITICVVRQVDLSAALQPSNTWLSRMTEVDLPVRELKNST